MRISKEEIKDRFVDIYLSLSEVQSIYESGDDEITVVVTKNNGQIPKEFEGIKIKIVIGGIIEAL